MSIVYGVALLLVARPHTPVRLVQIAAAALVLATLYELFRISYYGALLPNSAIAKDPTATDWRRGWYSLKDFLSPYVLWIPIAVVASVFLFALGSGGSQSGDARRLPPAATERSRRRPSRPRRR
jgi:arabinofuranosyltransferase